ncbi:pyruvate dehydrogenase E2 component (dihydrolipoamide acetyltransferase) [Arthrobacter pigmenti]|uniref:Dihydrolipoamide acetyltransferase component of pyruvate dehydrogenase complex n=1 Tax=Arthrobacter pigmenti TaxID=271432 RepID=A0A846RQ88_9MICC|nr:dihydrolipoamide acetyltransferase family protein [Arthrobacter pigmenti]NJC21905.1 pyruvate dehydrogenase E2 component (dihydrolipoamide acetyltransferase) [Arthrobacter pigmenti]
MIKEFRLPDLGEGLTESEIVSWHVAVGDTVELNQVIADVETAKAVVELPSPYAGVVAKLHEQPGTVVEVGAPIVSFDIPGGEAETAAPDDDAAPAKREPNLVGYGAAVEKSGRPTRRARRGAAPTLPAKPADAPTVDETAEPAAVQDSFSHTESEPEAPANAGGASAERPRSTPPVRKLARDLGVDLGILQGSGPQGLITRDDVMAAQGGKNEPAGESAPEASNASALSTQRETRIPIKGVRKHTAAAMVTSAFTAPHVTEFLTVDVTESMELLARLKSSRAFADVRINVLTLVAKALCIALDRNPTLNSRWDEAAQEIVQHHYVNLGIAAATPRGLMVPNIKDAQALGLRGLADALKNLTDTARAGKTSPADLSGGTISITNVGVFGIDAGTPILNPGEAAILAMGSVRKMPWEHRDEIALRQVMTLSLSFDHRLVDGEQGSRFLADLGTILSDPGMVLTMV